MEGVIPNFFFFPNPLFHRKERKRNTGKEGTSKERLDEATINELRRNNLCFHYKDPWVPGHMC
jgi:hypothetical protein